MNLNSQTLLYRCRKKTKYNIDAFCRDCVNGTIYSEFLQYGELNIWIPSSFLEKNNVSKEQAELTNAINIISNNYYLACFTLTNPLTTKQLLAQYAEKDGFVLVYNYYNLKNAVTSDSLINSNVLSLRKVHYTDKKYSILPFMMPLLQIADQHGGDEESLAKKFYKYIDSGSYPEEMGKCAVGMFYNKTNKYRIDNEVRLVMQRRNKHNKYPDMLNARPLKVLISKNMDIFSRKRIENHANEIGILVEYY